MDALHQKPELTEEEIAWSTKYWEVLKISRMSGEEYVTPTTLVTYYNLYPVHDIEERARSTRLFLEVSLAHKRVADELAKERAAEAEIMAKALEKNKAEYENLKARKLGTR